jgi:hypothetical protein
MFTQMTENILSDTKCHDILYRGLRKEVTDMLLSLLQCSKNGRLYWLCLEGGSRFKERNKIFSTFSALILSKISSRTLKKLIQFSLACIVYNLCK